MPQEHDALPRSEHRKVAFQAGARECESFSHALPERARRRCGNALIQDAEAAARQRQEQRGHDDMHARQFENVFDRHRRVTVEECGECLKEAIDIAFVEREQEFLLAREIEIYRPFGEPRFLGDLGHVRNAVG